MSLGQFIRRMFGPYERQISEAYRAIFVDVDDYVARIRAWVPDARRILEVGCGEGAVSERLAAAYPDAEIIAIDIAPNVGRLYAGPPGRVRFLQATIDQYRAASPGEFDLVVLADVVHHVPLQLRAGLLDAIRRIIAPGGHLAFKEWERNRTPIHWLGYLSDRWITGDRISYMSRDELHRVVAQSFGRESIVAEERVRPWRNNLSLLVRP
jgi:2-polyprenyl-6-hydroxyphenyl methylase/3-demethylubiquinone-9 3-methyltransferase